VRPSGAVSAPVTTDIPNLAMPDRPTTVRSKPEVVQHVRAGRALGAAAGWSGEAGQCGPAGEGGCAELPDQDAETRFSGAVAVVTGRQDRVVGYADQFRALRHYPRATYSVLDGAGHYLPS
jgi:pimeloyl-ACP methyl ester carboxylesterase